MNYTPPKTPNPDDGVAEVNEPAVAYGVARAGGDAGEYGTIMKTAAAPRSRRTIDRGNGDEIIIKPVRKHNLSEMLSQITQENIHGEVKSSGPVGKEIW